MIVRAGPGVLQLITQPDHARLARAIMEHCVPLARHPRRDAILHAIAEHDNGWEEEDAAPGVNLATGEIFDFVSAPDDVRQGVWPRGVARLAAAPFAAALVAQHAITIYDRYRSEPAWSPFFARMEAMRDEMLAASGLAFDDLVGDYVFVRLADLISLTFCTGWSDEQRFGDWAVQLTGTSVRVAPDAFGGVRVPVSIAAREVRARVFRSDAELRRALLDATATTLSGMVAGRSRS